MLAYDPLCAVLYNSRRGWFVVHISRAAVFAPSSDAPGVTGGRDSALSLQQMAPALLGGVAVGGARSPCRYSGSVIHQSTTLSFSVSDSQSGECTGVLST